MSIRSILEQKLATILPTIGTKHENTPDDEYKPIAGTPYQTVQQLFAEPEDLTITNDLIKDSGIMQITLYYPLAKGSKDIEARAKLIRSTFPRGLKLTDGVDEVRISATPSVKNIGQNSDRFIFVVSVYWKSYS